MDMELISSAAWGSGEQSELPKTIDSKQHLHGFCRTVQLLLAMQSKLSASTQRDLMSLLCSNDSFRSVSSSTVDNLLEAVAQFSISDCDIFIRVAHYAFKNGFQDLAEMFVRSESKFDLRTYTFGLFYSAKHEWADMYEYLTRNGVDVDSEIGGHSAVLRSCREKNFDMAHFLIKLGAKLKERNFLTANGRYYYFKCRNKHHPIRNYSQFSVKIHQNGNCTTALLYPVILHNDPSFQHILQMAVNIVEHPRDYCEKSTSRAENKEEVMKIVVTEIASQTVTELLTLDLHCCARMGLVKGMTFLLNTDIDVNFVRNGKTALMVACEEGHRACVDSLIRRGASIDRDWLFPLSDKYLNTVNFHRAGKEFDISACVKTLCRTMLFRVVADEDIETISLLLSRGWHVDMMNEEGDTPLSVSCAKGNVTMVEFLVSHGADLGFCRRDEVNSCGCVFMLLISSRNYDTSRHSPQGISALVRKILQEMKKKPAHQLRLIAEAVFARGSLYLAEILIEVVNCDTLKSYDFLMPLCIKRNRVEFVKRALTDKDNDIWNQIVIDFFLSVLIGNDNQSVKFLLENEPSLKDSIDQRFIHSMLDRLRRTSGSPEFARCGLVLQTVLVCCNSVVDDIGDRGLRALLRVITIHQVTAVQELLQACEEYHSECLKLENNSFLHPIHDPLCVASRSGDVKSVEMLIANGADVNAVVLSETPLFYAVRGTSKQMGVDSRYVIKKYSLYSRYVIIEILLKAGADPNIGASAGKKRRPLLKYVLHLIKKDGVLPTSWNIITMLVQYGTILETNYNYRYLLTPWKAGSGLVRLIQRYNGVLYSVPVSRYDLIRYLFLAGADLNLLLSVRNAHRQDNEPYKICTDLCKALVLSGSRICQSELEMIEYAFDTGKEFCLWYRREMQSPNTLQNTCRTFIRTHCREVRGKRSILPALKSLPLPNTLKRYLQFDGQFSEVDLMPDTEHNP